MSRLTRRPATARRRALTAIAASATLAVALGACGSDDDSSTSAASSTSGAGDTPVRIAMLGIDNKNNYTQWWYKGAKDAAEKAGAEVTLVDGKSDAKSQAAALQNIVTSKKFDAVAVLSVDPQSNLPVVKQAGDAGLKVVVDATLGNVSESDQLDPKIPEVTSVVGVNQVTVAENFAKNIEAACDAKVGPGAPCKVGYMPGAAVFPINQLQRAVVKDRLKDAPNISIEIAPDGGYSRPGGYKSMTTFLQNHKDIDVLHGDGDQQVAGAEQAIEEAGLTPGKDILMVGYGGTEEAFEGIKDGTWFATVIVPLQRMAATMVDFAAKAVRGEKVPRSYNVLTQPPGTIVALDKGVLDEHPELEPEWSEAAPR